jgi:hypothetical protein
MGTPYEDGVRFERQVIGDLTSEGYLTIRAAGSKGKTKIDVVAIKGGEMLIVQCKKDGIIPPAERVALLHTAALLNVNQPINHDLAVPIIARHQHGHKKPIYERLFGSGPHDRAPFHTDEIAI